MEREKIPRIRMQITAVLSFEQWHIKWWTINRVQKRRNTIYELIVEPNASVLTGFMAFASCFLNSQIDSRDDSEFSSLQSSIHSLRFSWPGLVAATHTQSKLWRSAWTVTNKMDKKETGCLTVTVMDLFRKKLHPEVGERSEKLMCDNAVCRLIWNAFICCSPCLVILFRYAILKCSDST